jgi:hypothetical protein
MIAIIPRDARDMESEHMALIKCEECYMDVSTDSKNCYNCGEKIPAQTQFLRRSILMMILVIASIATYAHLKSKESVHATAAIAVNSSRR